MGLELRLERDGKVVGLLVDFVGEIESGSGLAGRGASSLLKLDLVGEGWAIGAA